MSEPTVASTSLTKPVKFGHAHVELPLTRRHALHISVGHATPYDCFWPRPYWTCGFTRGAPLARGFRLGFLALHVTKPRSVRLAGDASGWWGP